MFHNGILLLLPLDHHEIAGPPTCHDFSTSALIFRKISDKYFRSNFSADSCMVGVLRLYIEIQKSIVTSNVRYTERALLERMYLLHSWREGVNCR